jgi:signal transduction histidine kinase/ActR/RegA family two-component response regulator
MTDDRVLVWAAPKDARLTCEFLSAAGLECVPLGSWREARGALDEGAGVLIAAGEILTLDVIAELEAYVRAQPTWSDLPIVIVAAPHQTERLDLIDGLGNVSVLQRPLSLSTLRSTVTAARRARRRQYQVRELLQLRDEADRRKDEFLAMLAHELRNPLAPLRTGLQLLHLQPPDDVVARTYEMMERQIAHITRLVDDLLDVSRVTRGAITLQKQVVDLGACARQVVDNFAAAAAQKDVQLLVDVASDALVDADPVRIEQMVGNLVSNAIKFTPERGSVLLVASIENQQAVLRVRDTGVGIPPDQLPFVFDLFAQTKRALDRSQGGLGIGLTVVKLLAGLHGGTITLHSDGEGKGTEAVLSLPRAAMSTQPSTAARPPAAVTLTRNRQRVLIIEDNQDAADMLATYLRFAGHEVRIADDGPSGLRIAFEMIPTVILCDIGLPGMDGYQVAQCVRAAPALKQCVLIAVTGYGEVTSRERAREAGFTHHLTKPTDPSLLAELINSVPSAV